MDKAEAEKLANELLSRYALPEDERVKGITGVLMVYGVSEGGLTKQVVENMRKQIEEQPEKATIRLNGIDFVMKRTWIEGDEDAGKLMAEYGRVE